MISFVIMGVGPQAYDHYLQVKDVFEPITNMYFCFCKNKNTLMEWNVRTNPTYVVIVDGWFVSAREGAMGLDALKEYLELVSRNIQREIFRKQPTASEGSRDIVLYSAG